MNKLLCSVVMPLYNKAREVPSTILSILNQTVADFELLIVNDGSTDSSVQVVESLKDNRIIFIHQQNAGVSAARNTGIRAAKTDLIVFIDADDLWHTDFLETVLALQEDYPSAKWFATGYQILHPESGSSFSRLRGVEKDFKRGILTDYFGVAVCSDPPVWSSATAVLRDAILSIGGFPQGIGSGEDLLTWARLAVRYPLAYESSSHAVFRASNIHRRADPVNKVGQALLKLQHEFPNVANMRIYLGLWYRMQAVMAMRYDDILLCLQYGTRAVRYAPFEMRNIYILILALLPNKLRQLIEIKARELLS
jgi:glycosyltransferase involved in cell wall biosynthesis